MALTKYNWNSFDVTPVASRALGFNSDADGLTSIVGTNLVLIKTLTASSSATLDFVDGSTDVVLDNTYPIYKLDFINIELNWNQTVFQGLLITGVLEFVITEIISIEPTLDSILSTGVNFDFIVDE